MLKRSWLAVVLLSAVACGGAVEPVEGGSVQTERRVDTPPPPPPAASPPSDTGTGAAPACETNDACVVVFSGPRCDCDCDAVIAIPTADAEAYAASREGPRCDHTCGACPARAALCSAGTCVVAP